MMNEQIIWNYLYKKLNNPYGVAGLMGNLFAESSLNPIACNVKKYGITSKEYTDITDSGINDNFITDGVAYGLAQWCYHTRKKALLNMAKTKKKSVGDINLQLDYLWSELQAYKTVTKTLINATTIREASDIVLLKYEKPANTSETVKQKRASYGQKYFNKYFVSETITTTLNMKNAIELRTELGRKLK